MFFLLLLFLTYINMVEITKIEDISICINDTNCNELIDSNIYIQIPKVNGPSLENNFSNDTEKVNIFSTTIPTEISSRISVNVTQQLEIQSTLTTIFSTSLTTISSPTTHLNDNEILILKGKEICECDLTVRASITFDFIIYLLYFLFFI